MKKSQIARGIMSVHAETPSQVEIKTAIEGVQQAFHDFKAANDQRLEALEKGKSTADIDAKISKIDEDVEKFQSSIDDLNVKLAAVQMNGPTGKPVVDGEYSGAFEAHMRKGDVQASMQKGVDADGGYLAPKEWDRTITDRLQEISPMRRLSNVITISSAGFKKLFNNHGAESGWVGETDARPETVASKLASLEYTTGEIYANPAATQQLLDDAEINLESWLATEVQTEFAIQEAKAFISGDGVNKPFGLLTFAQGGANDAKHPWGAIETIPSGDANGIIADSIIDITEALNSAYTGNANFLLNRATRAVVRKLKDGQGNYLWEPSYQAGVPARLSGYGVEEVPDMPNIAANALALAFGDIRRAYLIVDRVGIRVLRDPYTNKPYVLFYTTKRVGGGLYDPDAVKLMKIGE